MSSNLSVAHLGPRSLFWRVLWVNWLTRAALGWLVALPLICAVGASGLGALPQADRALFEAGGLWLVELFFREMHALSGGLRAGVLLAVAALVLRIPVTALLFASTVDPKASLSLAFRRGLSRFPRFLGLFVLELLGRVLVLGFTLLTARALESLGPHPANEALADLVPSLAYVLGFLLFSWLSAFHECCRAVSMAAPKLPFGGALSEASRLVRASLIELTGAFVLYVGVSALLLAAGARGVETLDVSRPGALRVAGAFAAHQAALFALGLLQMLWLRRVVSLTQPGLAQPTEVSPSALR